MVSTRNSSGELRAAREWASLPFRKTLLVVAGVVEMQLRYRRAAHSKLVARVSRSYFFSATHASHDKSENVVAADFAPDYCADDCFKVKNTICQNEINKSTSQIDLRLGYARARCARQASDIKGLVLTLKHFTSRISREILDADFTDEMFTAFLRSRE